MYEAKQCKDSTSHIITQTNQKLLRGLNVNCHNKKNGNGCISRKLVIKDSGIADNRTEIRVGDLVNMSQRPHKLVDAIRKFQNSNFIIDRLVEIVRNSNNTKEYSNWYEAFQGESTQYKSINIKAAIRRSIYHLPSNILMDGFDPTQYVESVMIDMQFTKEYGYKGNLPELMKDCIISSNRGRAGQDRTKGEVRHGNTGIYENTPDNANKKIIYQELESLFSRYNSPLKDFEQHVKFTKKEANYITRNVRAVSGIYKELKNAVGRGIKQEHSMRYKGNR